jgi:hypothetical protein
MTVTTLITVLSILVALLVGFVLKVVKDVTSDLAGDEARALLEHASRKKVQRVALQFPPEQRDILEAWEADLDEYCGRPLAMFMVATRIARSSRALAGELQEAALESEALDASVQNTSLRILRVLSRGRVSESAIRLVSSAARQTWSVFVQFVGHLTDRSPGATARRELFFWTARQLIQLVVIAALTVYLVVSLAVGRLW